MSASFIVAFGDDFDSNASTEGGCIRIEAESLVDAIIIGIRRMAFADPRWCFLWARAA